MQGVGFLGRNLLNCSMRASGPGLGLQLLAWSAMLPESQGAGVLQHLAQAL